MPSFLPLANLYMSPRCSYGDCDHPKDLICLIPRIARTPSMDWHWCSCLLSTKSSDLWSLLEVFGCANLQYAPIAAFVLMLLFFLFAIRRKHGMCTSSAQSSKQTLCHINYMFWNTYVYQMKKGKKKEKENFMPKMCRTKYRC